MGGFGAGGALLWWDTFCDKGILVLEISAFCGISSLFASLFTSSAYSAAFAVSTSRSLLYPSRTLGRSDGSGAADIAARVLCNAAGGARRASRVAKAPTRDGLISPAAAARRDVVRRDSMKVTSAVPKIRA